MNIHSPETDAALRIMKIVLKCPQCSKIGKREKAEMYSISLGSFERKQRTLKKTKSH